MELTIENEFCKYCKGITGHCNCEKDVFDFNFDGCNNNPCNCTFSETMSRCDVCHRKRPLNRYYLCEPCNEEKRIDDRYGYF